MDDDHLRQIVDEAVKQSIRETLDESVSAVVKSAFDETINQSALPKAVKAINDLLMMISRTCDMLERGDAAYQQLCFQNSARILELERSRNAACESIAHLQLELQRKEDEHIELMQKLKEMISFYENAVLFKNNTTSVNINLPETMSESGVEICHNDD